MIRSPGCRWRRLGTSAEPLKFLRSQEAYCVAGAGRLFAGACDDAWWFQDSAGTTTALLLNSKGTLFPVFNGRADMPLPRFVQSLVRNGTLHAAQGVRRDVEILSAGLGLLGAAGVETIEFDLLSLERPPNSASLCRGPPNLVLRPPNPGDTEPLYRLHAAYEQEEVVPASMEFCPAACRLTLERLIAHERVLIAELGGRIIGKSNTTGSAFSRRQIGGVYVLPEYRRLGVATRLTAVLAREIIAEGNGITLFVKKHNLPARLTYRRIGFAFLADYRIVYY